MGKYSCKSSARFYLGTTFIPNLYQWFGRKPIFKSKAFCRWHFLIFYSAWFEYLWKRNQWRLEKDWGLSSLMESEFQYQSLNKLDVIFSLKRNKPHHPDIIFNGNPVKNSFYQKYLGMFLNSKPDFDGHIKGVFDSNLLVLFASVEFFNKDHFFYKSINLLLDFT